MKRNFLNLVLFVAINVTLAVSAVAIAKEVSGQDYYVPKYKGKGTR
jgi:hypothetical protein